MATRTVLIIHPNEDRRRELRALFPTEPVIEAGSRQEALAHLSKQPLSLVLSHHEDFRKLLRDLDRHAPSAVRAVLCPTGDERVRQALVDVATEGYHFLTVEDASAATLRALWQSRDSGRLVPPAPLTARFVLGDKMLRCRVVELGNDGLGLLTDPGTPLEKLTPGTRLHQAVVQREDTVLVEGGAWIIRSVRASGDFGRAHVGVSFAPMREDDVLATRLEDGVRIRGLLRRAVRRHASFVVSPIDGSGAQRFHEASTGTDGSRYSLGAATGPVTFTEGDLVRLTFEFGGRSYSGACAVLSVSPASGSITVSRPRKLTLHHRRSSLRIRSDGTQDLRIRIRSPLSDEWVERRLIDLHAGGCSFAFDARSELFPSGLLLPDLTVIVDGHEIPARGTVQSTSALKDAATANASTRRCGLRLSVGDPQARQVLLDALISHRCPEVQDGSWLNFKEIWELFRAGNVTFPDYPLEPGAHLPMLEHAHAKAGNGAHGLTKTLIYKNDDGLQGHSSGLRIYANTWLSQHLVVRPGYHRHESISQELVNLMVDYAEALEDVEYQRGLWRTYNRWTSRIYGAIVSRMGKAGLTSLTAFTPCRLPIDAPLPVSTLRAHPASRGDLKILLSHLRAIEDVVRLRSSDLVEGQLGLEDLSDRYAANGLRRGRTVAVVDGKDGPRGWVIMEDITPGLFWAEWYNAYRLVLVEPNAADADQVRQALIAYAHDDARRRGRPVSECLADDADVGTLQRLGYANLGKVMEWTIHRSLAREWAEQLHSVFERLATPRPGRGGGTDDTQEAA